MHNSFIILILIIATDIRYLHLQNFRSFRSKNKFMLIMLQNHNFILFFTIVYSQITHLTHTHTHNVRARTFVFIYLLQKYIYNVI